MLGAQGGGERGVRRTQFPHGILLGPFAGGLGRHHSDRKHRIDDRRGRTDRRTEPGQQKSGFGRGSGESGMPEALDRLGEAGDDRQDHDAQRRDSRLTRTGDGRGGDEHGDGMHAAVIGTVGP